MDQKKDKAEDSIIDFVDDEEYYQTRRNKQQVENATWAIYIFATVSLMFYILYLLMYSATFDWINFAINLILIIIYFCLGAYSSHKPYTAFISLFCVLGIVFLSDILLAEQLNLKGIVIKIVLVVYISMRLELAKKVQAYESRAKK